MQTLEDDDAVIELLDNNSANESAAAAVAAAAATAATSSNNIVNGNGQGELVTKKMIKEERFCQTFGLSLNEKVLKSFPCFLVAEILIQGTMTITERHICFYSNIPGLKRNIKIRFADVVLLSKEKVYAFFPTGIGVHTRQEKTVFSYVTSRDKLLLFLRNHWENYSEVEEDFCSSVRGSSIDDGQMDGGQGSSREASVLNDEDSGILVAPSVAAASSAATANAGASSATSPDSATATDSGPTEESAAGSGADDDEVRIVRAGVVGRQFLAERRQLSTRTSPLSRWQLLINEWDGLPNRHALSAIAFFVLLCAIVIVYLSYRLNSLQEQLLLLVSMRSGHGQSEMDHLTYKLGGIVETLGGLQQKLGSLRHLLHSLYPPDSP